MEPKYEAAAEELFVLNPAIVLARVNGDKEKNLYNRMGLNGYPTIFVFHNGRYFEYEGLRRTDGKLHIKFCLNLCGIHFIGYSNC